MTPSLHDQLQAALDAATAGEHAEVAVAGASPDGREVNATLTVTDVDRLGVRLRRIAVRRPSGRDVVASAAALPGRLERLLSEPLVAVEIAPQLGKATLRTPVDEMRNRRYFDLEIQREGELVLRRFEVDEAGQRQPHEWTLTRQQLGQLVDELAQGG